MTDDKQTPDLFAPPPPRRARRKDPPTSQQAADRVIEFDSGHYALIVAALKRHGPATHHEIAGVTGLNFAQVHKRLPELERKGHIERTAETRLSPTRRPCIVWQHK